MPTRVEHLVRAKAMLVAVDQRIGVERAQRAKELKSLLDTESPVCGVIMGDFPTCSAKPTTYMQGLSILMQEVEESAAFMLLQLCSMWSVSVDTMTSAVDMNKVTAKHAKVQTLNRVWKNAQGLVAVFESEKKNPSWTMASFMDRSFEQVFVKRGRPSRASVDKRKQRAWIDATHVPGTITDSVSEALSRLFMDVASHNQNSITIRHTEMLVAATTATAMWSHETNKSYTCTAFFMDPYRCLVSGIVQEYSLRTYIGPAALVSRLVGTATSVFAKELVTQSLRTDFHNKDFLKTGIRSWVGGRDAKSVKMWIEHLFLHGWIQTPDTHKYCASLQKNRFTCTACNKTCLAWKSCNLTPACASAERKLPRGRRLPFVPLWPDMERLTNFKCPLNFRTRHRVVTSPLLMVLTRVVPCQYVEICKRAFAQYAACEDFHGDIVNKPSTVWSVCRARTRLGNILGMEIPQPSLANVNVAYLCSEQKTVLRNKHARFNAMAVEIMCRFDAMYGEGVASAILDCPIDVLVPASFYTSDTGPREKKRRRLKV